MQLQLSNISHQYAGDTLFEIPELVLSSGELVRLQGANGAGKSTLLKIMAGILKPTQGKVQLRYASGEQPTRQGVIYVHQQPYLFDMSARGNVEYGLRLRGEPDRRSVDEVLVWAQLDHIQHRVAHHLSGGERQRLALARAMVLSPKLVLLDEPSSNLDEASTQWMRDMLVDMCQQGTGCMVISHQTNLLPASCNTYWKIDQGKVLVSSESSD